MAQQHLGFGNSIQPKIVFVGKESGCLWYQWNREDDKAIPIAARSLTGYLRKVEKIERVSDYGVTEKLVVTIDADETYQIQVGFSTWFAKALLLNINALDEPQLRSLVTIEPNSNSNSKVIFCNLYDWRKSKINSGREWQRDNKGKLIDSIDYDVLLVSIAVRLPNSNLLEEEVSEIEPEENLETFTDPETGEVLF
jgi:hypothetical protein